MLVEMHVINLLWLPMFVFHHLMAVMCCDRCKLMNVTVVFNSDDLTQVLNKEDILTVKSFYFDLIF